MPQYTNSNIIKFGKRILPLKRIQIFSPDEWEEFIEEWVDCKKSEYYDCDRFGGAGDKGRDVVAYKTDKTQPNYNWDCYQCKHYDRPLMPSQVHVEIGKILYYTYQGDYPVPDKYYFVSPKGSGTKLSKLLNEAASLKKEIIDNWDKNCQNQITNSCSIVLEGAFRNYVNNFDYSIFDKLNIKNVIEEHKTHPNHLARFGGGLPAREKLESSSIPVDVQPNESVYIQQLYNAYNSHSGNIYKDKKDFESEAQYHNHFNRARISFHHAEQLRNFSRDNIAVGTFEDYQDEILSGVIDITEDMTLDGFTKVKKVETEARKLSIESNPLKDVTIVQDKSGVCHQLANENKLKWT